MFFENGLTMLPCALIRFGKKKKHCLAAVHAGFFKKTHLYNFKELSSKFAMYQETPETFALIKDLLSHTLLLFDWL